MPIVTVNVWEDKLDEDIESKLIESLTGAVTDVFGGELREYTTVLVIGIPRSSWGIGGVPSSRLYAAPEERG